METIGRRLVESFARRLTCLRHLSEQYFTSSQFFAQLLRHVIARWHTTQILLAKLDLLPLNVVCLATLE